MYSEDDINSAVAAGALTPEAAESFRSHMSQVRELPRSSEENVRLINSFNDIFVAIGIVILLLAVGAIGQAIGGLFGPAEGLWEFNLNNPNASSEEVEAYADARNLRQTLQIFFAGILVAAASWPLAEFFTRRRRMALPSILLLLAFVGGIFASLFGLGAAFGMVGSQPLGAAVITLAGLVAGGAAYLHWRRFRVPITVAAGVGVLVIALLIAVLGVAQVDPGSGIALGLILIAGIGVFAFAMRWDMRDRQRITRSSDVAFWLHLLAAPMIAHPIFALLGVTEGDNLGVGAAFGVLAVYVGFGLVALAIDRRALLVSALAYVLFALTFLFREFGAVELNFALTALVIGSALLSLSAFWLPIRKSVVNMLPLDLQAKLPATEDLPAAAAEPTLAA